MGRVVPLVADGRELQGQHPAASAFGALQDAEMQAVKGNPVAFGGGEASLEHDSPSQPRSGSGQEEQPQRESMEGSAGQPQSWVASLAEAKCLSSDDEWYTHYYSPALVAASTLSACMAPFLVAFAPTPGLAPHDSPLAVIQFTLIAIFAADILLKCCLGGDDPETGTPVTTLGLAFRQYLRGVFCWDMLFMMPFDLIILAAMGLSSSTEPLALYIGLLKFIQLGRLYRVSSLISAVEMRVSQTVMVLLRTLLLLLFSSHVFGCLYYWLARVEGFTPETWVGRHFERWEGQPTWARYVYALYFGVMAFGSGDQDFYAASPVEAIVMIAILCYNILLAAYILGIITLLMVKGEERLKLFKDRVHNLREYGHHNHLPEKLLEAMEEHLELHWQSEQASDEQVLAIYPATIRRRVLRELYLTQVKACPLLAGCRNKFLDAVLTSGRIETFLPRVQIIAKGDIVSEIYVILVGDVLATASAPPAHGGAKDKHRKNVNRSLAQMHRKQRRASVEGAPDDATLPTNSDRKSNGSMVDNRLSMSRNASFQSFTSDRDDMGERPGQFSDFRSASIASSGNWGGSDWGDGDGPGAPGTGATRKLTSSVSSQLGEGDAFGEVSFVTELGSHESVWSVSVVKCLTLSRATYEHLRTTFPHDARKMLENVEKTSEERVRRELIACLDHTKRMSEEVTEALHHLAIGDMRPSDLPASVFMEMGSLLKGPQHSLLDNLSKVKDALAKYTRKVDLLIIYEFLNACSGGDAAAVREALSSGMSPNAADYDRRNGLMLACHEGHTEVVKMLLEAGADPQLQDNFGGTAMWECVKMGHSDLISLMRDQGASLGMDGLTISSQMGSMVFEGDLVQLRRMVLSGANANTPDYFGATPLHVAAATGNLTAAKLLVKEGSAKVDLKDCWGHTPLDLARTMHDEPLVEFLGQLTSAAQAEAKTLAQKMEFLNYCSEGNAGQVRSALALGMSANTSDYDTRTGLMLACHSGQEEVAKLLLAAGADPMVKDSFGNTAMWECVTMGRQSLIDLLLKAGGSLGMDGMLCSAHMSKAIREGDLLLLRMMLRAKTSPDLEDHLQMTPLFTACTEQNLTAVRMLIEEANATVDVVDCLGRTPLSWAQELNCEEVVNYLEPLTVAALQGKIKNRSCPTLPPAASLLLDSGLPPIVIETRRPGPPRGSVGNSVELTDWDRSPNASRGTDAVDEQLLKLTMKLKMGTADSGGLTVSAPQMRTRSVDLPPAPTVKSWRMTSSDALDVDDRTSDWALKPAFGTKPALKSARSSTSAGGDVRTVRMAGATPGTPPTGTTGSARFAKPPSPCPPSAMPASLPQAPHPLSGGAARSRSVAERWGSPAPTAQPPVTKLRASSLDAPGPSYGRAVAVSGSAPQVLEVTAVEPFSGVPEEPGDSGPAALLPAPRRISQQWQGDLTLLLNQMEAGEDAALPSEPL